MTAWLDRITTWLELPYDVAVMVALGVIVWKLLGLDASVKRLDASAKGLDATANDLKADAKESRREIQNLTAAVEHLRSELKEQKAETKELRGEVASVKDNLADVKARISKIEGSMDTMGRQHQAMFEDRLKMTKISQAVRDDSSITPSTSESTEAAGSEESTDEPRTPNADEKTQPK